MKNSLLILIAVTAIWISIKQKVFKLTWPLFVSYVLLVVRFVWNQIGILILFERMTVSELIHLFSTIDIALLIPQFLFVLLSLILTIRVPLKNPQ